MGLIEGREPKPADTSEVRPRVVVKVRDEARRERALRDRPRERRAGEPEEDVGRELVDALAYLGDVMSDRQRRVADEAHLES
ncbi:hypothetical protein, partial [Agromyces sp. CCNWLW208]